MSLLSKTGIMFIHLSMLGSLNFCSYFILCSLHLLHTGQVGSTTFHHEECAKSQCSETIRINFDPHFAKTPLLMYGFSLLDIQEDRNLRIELSVVQVATDAATLKVRTWADTIVNWSTVRWMACPQ